MYVTGFWCHIFFILQIHYYQQQQNNSGEQHFDSEQHSAFMFLGQTLSACFYQANPTVLLVAFIDFLTPQKPVTKYI